MSEQLTLNHQEKAKELNNSILNITIAIQELFPELSKYLGEVPTETSIEENPEIAILKLQNHFHSLDSLLKEYGPNQGKIIY